MRSKKIVLAAAILLSALPASAATKHHRVTHVDRPTYNYVHRPIYNWGCPPLLAAAARRMAAQVAVPKGSLHHQIGGDDVCGRAKSVLDDHALDRGSRRQKDGGISSKKVSQKKGLGTRVFSVPSPHAGPA
jgi:hypothetical protein